MEACGDTKPDYLLARSFNIKEEKGRWEGVKNYRDDNSAAGSGAGVKKLFRNQWIPPQR